MTQFPAFDPIGTLNVLNDGVKSKSEQYLFSRLNDYLAFFAWHPNKDVPANLFERHSRILVSVGGEPDSMGSYCLKV